MNKPFLIRPLFLENWMFSHKEYNLEDNHDLINNLIKEKERKTFIYEGQPCTYNRLLINDEIICFSFKLEPTTGFSAIDVIINTKLNKIEIIKYYTNNFFELRGAFNMYYMEKGEMLLLENYYMPLIEAMDLIS